MSDWSGAVSHLEAALQQVDEREHRHLMVAASGVNFVDLARHAAAGPGGPPASRAPRRAVLPRPEGRADECIETPRCSCLEQIGSSHATRQ